MAEKKKFKDTVVGKIATGLLSVINPSLGNLVTGASSIGDVIADITKGDLPPDTKIELQKQLILAQQNEEEEVTKRAVADANSDSKLAQNIRPLTYLFFIGLFSLSMVLDSFDDIPFTITEPQLDVIQGTLFAMTGFYFGGRSLEKIMKAYKQT